MLEGKEGPTSSESVGGRNHERPKGELEEPEEWKEWEQWGVRGKGGSVEL